MRILITNDDGIDAPGLKVLEEIATQLAGDDGEVWTVAPAFEQSGVGHAISFTRPMMISQMGPRRFAADREGLDRPLRLRAPQRVGGDVDRTEGVGLGPCRESAHAQRGHRPPRHGLGRRALQRRSQHSRRS